MNKIVEKNNWGRVDVFEVVDKIPSDYFVWNIKPIGNGEYIPIAQWAKPNDKEDFTVNLNTLKAVYVGKADAQIIKNATAWGIGTLAKARSVANSKRAKALRRERAEKALPIFERISE